MARAGFKKVFSMEGGIRAWNGLVAKGAPEAGMAYFAPARRVEELIALAWLLEEGSRKFYAEMAGKIKDPQAQRLFSVLVAAEEKHEETLRAAYRKAAGVAADPNFPASVVPRQPEGDTLEGGIPLQEALEWAGERSLKEILEFSISSEVNAQDRYLKMERLVKEPEARGAFRVLAEEEKRHLERLVELFEAAREPSA